MSERNDDVIGVLSADQIMRELELLAMPANYDQCCAEGILERISKRQFKLLDTKRLPEHLAARMKTLTAATNESAAVVEFENTTVRAQKKLDQLRRRAR